MDFANDDRLMSDSKQAIGMRKDACARFAVFTLTHTLLTNTYVNIDIILGND